MTIHPYEHTCVIQDGPSAGNKYRREVSPYDVEYAGTCEHCSALLAEPAAIIAHIYEQLLEEPGQ